MNLSFMATHNVKPAFVAGSTVSATVVSVEDKTTGFTLTLNSEDVPYALKWHFNVEHTSEAAQRIARDELSRLIAEQKLNIEESEDFKGLALDVRLEARKDSALPRCCLPKCCPPKRGVSSLNF